MPPFSSNSIWLPFLSNPPRISLTFFPQVSISLTIYMINCMRWKYVFEIRMTGERSDVITHVLWDCDSELTSGHSTLLLWDSLSQYWKIVRIFSFFWRSVTIMNPLTINLLPLFEFHLMSLNINVALNSWITGSFIFFFSMTNIALDTQDQQVTCIAILLVNKDYVGFYQAALDISKVFDRTLEMSLCLPLKVFSISFTPLRW